MAFENDNQKAEKTAEIPAETVEKNVGDSTAAAEVAVGSESCGRAQSRRCGKRGAKAVVAVLLVAAIVAVFGIRQSRDAVAEKYRALVAAFAAGKASPTASETAGIEARLEQLENQRDFDAAAAEQPEQKPAGVAYAVLANDQNALRMEIDALRGQIAALKSENAREIGALRADLPKRGLIEERLLAMTARDDALESQLVDAGVKIDRVERNKADAATVLALVTRLEIAEQKLRASNAEKERAVALLLTAYQLREAVLSGGRFVTEQQSALAIAGGLPRVSEYIRSLDNIADRGVWTRAALTLSFDSYADRAVLADKAETVDDWFHNALNSLKKLVVVRRIDVPDTTDVSAQAVLARAQKAVDEDDIALAVEQLGDLRGAAADAMSEWTAEANGYLNAKKTVDKIISTVLGVLYAAKQGG